MRTIDSLIEEMDRMIAEQEGRGRRPVGRPPAHEDDIAEHGSKFRVTIMLSRDHREKLRQLVLDHGTTMSEMVSQLIREAAKR